MALRPYHPDLVTVMADGPRNIYRVEPRLPNQPPSARGNRAARDVLHFPNLVYDGERSLSTLSAAGNALGYKRAMDEFAREFYESGLQVDYLLSMPNAPTGDQIKAIKKFVQQSAHGSANSKFPLVLSKDTKAEKLNMTPRDSYLLELSDFRSKEIAQAFGVPNVLLNEDPKTQAVAKATNEVVDLFVRTTLAPIAHRIEQELERKLSPFNEARRYRFDWSLLLQANQQARYASYAQALGGQPWLAVNDVRRREGLEPMDGEEFDRPALQPGTPGTPPPQRQDDDGGDEGVDAPPESPDDGEDEGNPFATLDKRVLRGV